MVHHFPLLYTEDLVFTSCIFHFQNPQNKVNAINVTYHVINILIAEFLVSNI
jgi:hypothetical protein